MKLIYTFVTTNSLTLMCAILLADKYYDLQLSEDGKSVNVDGMVTPQIDLQFTYVRWHSNACVTSDWNVQTKRHELIINLGIHARMHTQPLQHKSLKSVALR